MTFLRVTPEQRREIAEDLLCIINAGRWRELVAVRRQMIREYRPPSPWQQLDADQLARDAAGIIGGTKGYWRGAAAAAVGIQSTSDVAIEAVCIVAEDVREDELKRAAPRTQLTIGQRKRGSR